MKNGTRTATDGFDGDRFGHSHGASSHNGEYDALASMPPEEFQREIDRQAKAKHAADFDAVSERRVAEAESNYYAELIDRKKRERDGWDQYLDDTPRVEEVADAPIQVNRKNAPELVQLGFQGAVFGGLLTTEITNGTMLVNSSGSAFAGNVYASLGLAAGIIFSILAIVHTGYHYAGTKLRKKIVGCLQKYGMWAIGLGILTFSALFGGSHEPVKGFGGDDGGGSWLYVLFTCTSLALLMFGLFSTELSIMRVMQKLRPTIVEIAQSFCLGQEQVKKLGKDILRLTRAKAEADAIVEYHEQAIEREKTVPTVKVAAVRQARQRRRQAAKKALEDGVTALKRKYLDDLIL